jgi:hypothetical protein
MQQSLPRRARKRGPDLSEIYSVLVGGALEIERFFLEAIDTGGPRSWSGRAA